MNPICQARDVEVICGQPAVWQHPTDRVWCCERHAPPARVRPRCACGQPGALRRPDSRAWLCLAHATAALACSCEDASPVLVVIRDARIRQLVGWIVAEMELEATLTATWREAIGSTTGAPACIVADLDDVRDKTAGVAALRKGWGGNVPLIILSHRSDIAEQATAVGALAGIRQPMNVGALMQAIRRAMGQE